MPTIERVTAQVFSQIIADAANERDETLDTRVGPIRDLYISPMARVLEQQNNRVVYLSLLNNMEQVNELVPDDVDDIVFNEGIIRWQGSRAITSVFFSRSQPPTSDIIVPVNHPLATEIDQRTGKAVSFRTIESKTMYKASPAAYYNADTRKYELEVTVSSIGIGEDVEVGPYTIKVFTRQVPGFDEVFNRDATTSGKPIETNRDLADRYNLHIEGSKENTPAGLKRSILDNFSTVTDAHIVYGEDEFLEREQLDAGAVDAWILGSVPLTRTYIVPYIGVMTLIPVDKQPLVSIKSIALTAGGVTYIEGTDYEVIYDDGPYYKSLRGQDGIRFLAGGTKPNVGDSITITYQYNSLISILNSYYTQGENFVMGIDRLFRWGERKDIEIEAQLKVSSGNPETVLNNVKGVIINYINKLKLGEDVEEFDIDSQIAKVRGVDNFIYIILAEQDGSGVSDISVDPNQYARIDEANLTINLV